LGIGDWGLGIGDWAQSPIPNPQSPIPNPQSPIPTLKYLKGFQYLTFIKNSFNLKIKFKKNEYGRNDE
jgi:hypothetical protein